MVLIANVQATFALCILTLILTSKEDRFHGRINSKILHDLGKLLFAFTIFWTYLSASQLIIIWPASLPQEITWYLDRTAGFWKAICVFVGLTMFAIPFAALLSQSRQERPTTAAARLRLDLASECDLLFLARRTTFPRGERQHTAAHEFILHRLLDRHRGVLRHWRHLGLLLHYSASQTPVTSVKRSAVEPGAAARGDRMSEHNQSEQVSIPVHGHDGIAYEAHDVKAGVVIVVSDHHRSVGRSRFRFDARCPEVFPGEPPHRRVTQRLGAGSHYP